MKTTLTEKIGFEYIRSLLTCSSPYGTENIRKLSPYKDPVLRDTELENISRVISSPQDTEKVDRLNRYFMAVKDIRRSIRELGNGTPDEVSFFEIKRFLLLLHEIKSVYDSMDMKLIDIDFPNCDDAFGILNTDGTSSASFFIPDSYSHELYKIRAEKREIERLIRSATDDAQITEYKLRRLEVADSESSEELRIRRELSEKLLPYREKLLYATEKIGEADRIFAKAALAQKLGAVRPHMHAHHIRMVQMQNPAVEKILNEKGQTLTPVDIIAESGSTVITGANMGGKSIKLRTLALNAYTAMCGMYVFAQEAHFPDLEGISMIAEDSEDLENGLSTFGGEIMRLKDELKNTDRKVLLLFDEPARGTNPQEGAKIVRALVKFLNTAQAISVFTTHYDGVAACARRHYRVAGLQTFDFSRASGKSGLELLSLNMDYSLYEAAPDESCPKEATEICKMLLKGEPLLDAILEE